MSGVRVPDPPPDQSVHHIFDPSKQGMEPCQKHLNQGLCRLHSCCRVRQNDCRVSGVWIWGDTAGGKLAYLKTGGIMGRMWKETSSALRGR